jgi:uncharacterized tellurite resistance protein B-like protein
MVLSRLKRIFDDSLADASAGDDERAEHALHRAAAALLVEMSRADHAVSDVECAHIARALEQVFGLSRAEVHELMSAGENDADAATSLYEFTRVLNERLDHERKVHFVDELWRVAYSDGELEKHEAHLVRKVADLLHLRHREYIGGKLKAEGG